MVKKILILMVWCISAGTVSAQSIVFDRDHFDIVNQNAVARLSSELLMHSYYEQIDQRLKDISINIGSLTLTQTLIYRSLTQVDQGLKSAIAVKELSVLLSEIFSETNQMVSFAAEHPHLLLFSQQVSTQLKNRGVSLLEDVSGVVLSEKSELLLDFEKRDALLKKISLELKVIRALVYSMRKSMYWAAQRSLLSQINPYQSFINIDKRLVEKIISNYKNLKK